MANQLNGQNKIVLLIVCLLLGAFGIHNLMLGEYKKCILRLVATFIFGLGFILALYDLVKILLNNYEANPTAWI